MRKEMSRRTFVEISGAALAATQLSAYQQQAGAKRLFAYVGRHTTGPFFGSGKGGGINVFRVDMSDGSLIEVSKTGADLEDLNSDAVPTFP